MACISVSFKNGRIFLDLILLYRKRPNRKYIGIVGNSILTGLLKKTGSIKYVIILVNNEDINKSIVAITNDVKITAKLDNFFFSNNSEKRKRLIINIMDVLSGSFMCDIDKNIYKLIIAVQMTIFHKTFLDFTFFSNIE